MYFYSSTYYLMKLVGKEKKIQKASKKKKKKKKRPHNLKRQSKYPNQTWQEYQTGNLKTVINKLMALMNKKYSYLI